MLHGSLKNRLLLHVRSHHDLRNSFKDLLKIMDHLPRKNIHTNYVISVSKPQIRIFCPKNRMTDLYISSQGKCYIHGLLYFIYSMYHMVKIIISKNRNTKNRLPNAFLDTQWAVTTISH